MPQALTTATITLAQLWEKQVEMPLATYENLQDPNSIHKWMKMKVPVKGGPKIFEVKWRRYKHCQPVGELTSREFIEDDLVAAMDYYNSLR